MRYHSSCSPREEIQHAKQSRDDASFPISQPAALHAPRRNSAVILPLSEGKNQNLHICSVFSIVILSETKNPVFVFSL
jgi:hypothetical protein